MDDLSVGAAVILFNGQGGEWAGNIHHIGKRAVEVRVAAWRDMERETPLRVTLAQGISSGERMDYTLQKSVELGVGAIQPIQAERSVVKLAGERMQKRMQHWQSVVASACEQSGRNRVPEVRVVSGLTQWLGRMDSGVRIQDVEKVLRIHLAPEAELSLRDLENPSGLVVLAAGPEGGFSENEHTALRQSGFIGVRLGPRVLRTETAALAALAALQILWGDY